MNKLLIALCFALCLMGCTAPDRSLRVLEDAGYTQIEVQGRAWFACSEDDTFATRFKALGPTGRPVAGAVCAGLFKGATIRMD